MQTLEAVTKEVDLITDGLNMPVDDKIKKTVIALRMLRVNTDGSCEGHRERGLPYPWVSVGLYLPEKDESGWIEDNTTEREKVEPLVNDFNITHSPKFPLTLQNQGMYGAFRIQSYSRDQEADPDRLEEYQEIMDAFAEFILGNLSQDS